MTIPRGELGMFNRDRNSIMTSLLFAAVILVLSSSLFAGSVGRIKGTITDDKTGEPLYGVSVQIDGSSMGAKTNIDGTFIILSVPPGNYDLKITHMGYGEVRVEGLQVNTDQTSENNIQMKQAVVETGKIVTVTGRRKGIDFLATGTVTIKTQQEILMAPVASVDDLLARETGITLDANGELHIRGGRAGETTYLVDGVNYSDPLGGRAPVDAGINISSAAVLELQIIKDGFDPEYGEALSGVIKITSPEGSPSRTRTRVAYFTDDFGSKDLNKYSENYDQLEFTMSGPDPFLTSRLLPAIGINYFEDKDFTFYIYGRALKNDTRNPYSRFNSPASQKQYSSLNLLGISIPDRQSNQYNFNFTVAFDPTNNMHAKALYKGTWTEGTQFTWFHRYSPATAPISTYQTNTFSLQMKQVLSTTTDYEINLSYWGSRYVEMPGDPDHPGQGLTPDEFLFRDQYESYNDLNNNNRFDPYEPFLNVFPDSVQHGSIYIPQRNDGDIFYAIDDQVGGPWFPAFDLNNNGIIDRYEGEPFADMNGNGIWDSGDELTSDINGNRTYDDIYRDVTGTTSTSREEPYIDGDSSLGEPFTDINRNGVYDPGVDLFITAMDPAINQDLNRNNRYDGPNDPWEPGIPYIDFNGNHVYDGKNSQYDPGEPYIDINKNGVHDLGGDNSAAFLLYGFGASGDYATVWAEESVDKYTAKGNFKKAIGRAHEIKTGFEFRKEVVGVSMIKGLQQYNSRELDNPDGFPYHGRGTVRDFYTRRPYVMVLYFRDKIEYGSLVASLGLRADVFFQDELKGISTIQDAIDEDIIKIKDKISPRVSINYPISEKAMIRFNYGHFYELPPYSRMYRSANPLGTGTDDLIGNPNLDYTKTINYTFGVNYAFSDEYSLKISGYYKDYFDIIATSLTLEGRQLSYYDNTDYARIRGIEMELTREASRFVNGTLAYEYQFAYGKSSSDAANYEQLAALDQISIDENPLDWDIRQRVSLWLQFYFSDRDHPRLFGIAIPNDWDMSIYWKFQTGFPFTPSKEFPNLKLDVGELPLTNSMRLPSTTQTDIKINKRFRISGMTYEVFAWIDNLFDNKNVVSVYGATGMPETGNVNNDIIREGTERQSSPTRWGRGRQIKVGLGLQF